MSHGGFGGGGHGHVGHHGGGHAGHHGSHFAHSGAAAGHHGTIIGHLLHALGHHGHHCGHGAGHHSMHHPDQAPTWSQALQGGTFWQKLLRIDKRPFAILFLMFFGGFSWLYIIYKIHHAEALKEHTAILSMGQNGSPTTPAAQPAAGPGGYGPPALPACAAPIAADNGYAAATTAGGQYGRPADYASAGSAFAPSAYRSSGNGYAGAVQSAAATAFGGNPGQYGRQMPYTPADAGLSGSITDRNQAISAPRSFRHALGGLNSYEPLTNGRQRLVVSR